MLRSQLDELYREQSRRVFASLVRWLKDFDLAEEITQDVFVIAWEKWSESSVPPNPLAWLIATAKNRAIDVIRRREQLRNRLPDVLRRVESVASQNQILGSQEIEDDRLRLMFTCCHPAIDPVIQVALTLREVCGLTTEEIASAFLVSPTTMAQRIVRGKNKIKNAGISFSIPDSEEIADRLGSILAVVYLIFNEGYAATSGDSLTRNDLCREAIRLGRLVVELLPDAEAMGLLALMLFHDSRRETRCDQRGDIVLLEEQDRSKWDLQAIEEGNAYLRNAWNGSVDGPYVLQAAIASVHANAKLSMHTDWSRIAELYDRLLKLQPSPVVELNRAVAIAMRDGPEKGIEVLKELAGRGELTHYYLLHAAMADLYRRMGHSDLAREAYSSALKLNLPKPAERFLHSRMNELPMDG